MRSTALAYDNEFDEASVSSTEVLEANVISIREELREFKAEFKDFRTETRAAASRLDQDIKAAVGRLDQDIKTAVIRLDNEIKAAVAELRAEIRAMATRAENDLRAYVARTDAVLSEVRNDIRELRAENKEFRDKLERMGADISTIGSKLNALFWVLGGLAALAGLARTLGWI